MVEWFEQLPDREELDALVVRISPGDGEEDRILEVSAQGSRAADALARLHVESR